MNTTSISAALTATPPAPDRGRSNGAGSESGSFSSVLDTRQSAQAQAQQPAARDAEPARNTEPARHGAGDAELAQNAAEQGLAGAQNPAAVQAPADPAAAAEDALAGKSLPQVALRLAAEIAAVQQSVSGRSAVDGKAAAAARDADAAGRADAFDPRLGARLEDAGRAAATEFAARQNPAGAALPASPLSADGLAAGKAQAPSSGLIGSARAASIAGARQALLTMQARARAAEAAPGAGAQAAGIQAPGFDEALARASADLSGGIGLRADPAQADPQAAAAAGMNSPTGLAAPAAQPAGASPAVATPLNSPQWGADFSRQFVALAQGGPNTPHTAELRLDPPELGPLRISINISDNVAHAVFVSPHASVRQTVENSLAQLQQALAQAGISLGEANVSDQGQQAEQAFNERFGGGSARGGAAFALDGNAADTAGAPAARRAAAPNALVDTFA
ncbi:flagellar hook-length control protein FliK [Parapusillimonas granuli]|uniref:Flagellar hook-length control protein FliK n=1 Tax=Parapusillimonas granuli TaxID=380911 RepID=A0A853G4X5_9BURK|nr:flagellar hook-length control protein FliK [Parapusillimonas granuli]MBB5213378.1 flagellar hook-length control protein FliK [Parapusillimonas granuli]NYT51933.1 flagellar hook-length control protein FliK [Parapusillimonas granuli]